MPEPENNTPSIMVRAKITPAEWEDFRVLALRESQPASVIVGQLMRDYIERREAAERERGEK